MESKKRILIKKEDRAFLYFRENKDGGLNIKFGPEKFTSDTSKFHEILMSGIYQCIVMISMTSKALKKEDRDNHYDLLTNQFNAILTSAFPDVFERIKKEEELVNIAVERVEDGSYEPSAEFQEKVDEYKKTVKEVMNKEKEERIERDKRLENDILDSITKTKKLRDKLYDKSPKKDNGKELSNEEDIFAVSLMDYEIEDNCNKLVELFNYDYDDINEMLKGI